MIKSKRDKIYFLVKSHALFRSYAYRTPNEDNDNIAIDILNTIRELEKILDTIKRMIRYESFN